MLSLLVDFIAGRDDDPELGGVEVWVSRH